MAEMSHPYDRTLNLLGRIGVALFGYVDNVRMFRVGNFITVFTLILLAAGVAATALTFKSVAEISGVWRGFDSGLARRIDLLGHFQHQLGYGGLARHWAAARAGDVSARQAVATALLKTREGFPAFLNASPSEAEQKYLAALENGVGAYEQALAGAPLPSEQEEAITAALAGISTTLAEKRKAGADAVENAIWSLSIKVGGIMFAAGLILTVFGLFTFWFIRFRVAIPLERIKSTMGGLSEGDTQVEVPFTAKADEVGEMARAVQVFKENAIIKQRMESRKREVTQSLQDTATELACLTHTARKETSTQATAATSMSAATEELSVSIDQVADSAQHVLAATEATVASVKDGERTVRETITIMEETANLITQATTKVAELARRSEEIQEIVTAIQGIAKQTDLLALNASIESARAGEAGRGFAVVAEQVRDLSEKTNTSAQNISSILSRIQTQMHEVTEEVTSASNKATESATRSREVGQSLAHIDQRTGVVADAIAEIANAVREQSITGKEIAQKVEMVATSSDKINFQINKINELTRSLEKTASST